VDEVKRREEQKKRERACVGVFFWKERREADSTDDGMMDDEWRVSI
jgi:hypothetical protein